MSRITISIVIGGVAMAFPFVCAGQAQKTFASAEPVRTVLKLSFMTYQNDEESVVK